MFTYDYGEHRVICHMHGITCEADGPHPLGSELCAYALVADKCGQCASGRCEFHRYDDGYNPLSEALTAYQRNE